MGTILSEKDEIHKSPCPARRALGSPHMALKTRNHGQLPAFLPLQMQVGTQENRKWPAAAHTNMSQEGATMGSGHTVVELLSSSPSVLSPPALFSPGSGGETPTKHINSSEKPPPVSSHLPRDLLSPAPCHPSPGTLHHMLLVHQDLPLCPCICPCGPHLGCPLPNLTGSFYHKVISQPPQVDTMGPL